MTENSDTELNALQTVFIPSTIVAQVPFVAALRPCLRGTSMTHLGEARTNLQVQH